MAGGDVFSPLRWKDLDLRDPAGIRVATEVRGDRLVARASPPRRWRFFVTLEADRPGRFSNNAIALFPGHEAEITFTPAAGDAAGTTVTVRDLHSSYTAA